MKLTDDTPVNTTLRNVLGAVVLIITTTAAVVHWEAKLNRVEEDGHARAVQLDAVTADWKVTHDLGIQHTTQIEGIAKVLDRVDRKLDYLTSSKINQSGGK